MKFRDINEQIRKLKLLEAAIRTNGHHEWARTIRQITRQLDKILAVVLKRNIECRNITEQWIMEKKRRAVKA